MLYKSELTKSVGKAIMQAICVCNACMQYYVGGKLLWEKVKDC